MFEQFKPRADRILLQILEKEWHVPQLLPCTVIAHGPGRPDKKDKPIPMKITVGDKVYIDKKPGLWQFDYVIVPEGDIRSKI